MPNSSSDFISPADCLAWLAQMGADEIIQEQALNRFAESARAAQVSCAAPTLSQSASASGPASAAHGLAMGEAASLNSIIEIAQALNFFETHPLRKNAMKLAFFEGPLLAEIMVIADHPRKEEDRNGLVFAGKSRLLLANMLKSIGLRLDDVALMNLMPWRPLGGAALKPTALAPVLPFVRRALELVRPKFILAFSALPGQHLAGGDASIQRQHGKWLDAGGIQLLSTFHPDELLRLPNLKRQAWRDLLAFRQGLS